MLTRLASMQVAAVGDRRPLDAALELVRAGDARTMSPRAAVEELGRWPAAQAHSVLTRHSLHVLWLEAVCRKGLCDVVEPALERKLSESRYVALAREMVQAQALLHAAAALDRAGVTWLTFKGMHLARVLYAAPHLRPACDIDILTRRTERVAAMKALEAAGFAYEPNIPNDDHEGTLRGHGAVIDLHWQLIRPGRAGTDLAELLLEGRERLGELWVPSGAHALAVMLLHPALTDHVTGSLHKAVDLDRWLRAHPEQLSYAVEVVEESGLRAAAWSMLVWTRAWLGTPVDRAQWRRLRPGALRRGYLRTWLALDPARLYLRWPNMVRGGFSLALQDDARGVARSLRQKLLGPATAVQRKP